MPPPTPPIPPATKKTNWWLIGGGGCLGLILLGILGFGALYFALTKVIKSTDPYKIAVDGATHSPEVQAELGTPIAPGFFIQGTVNSNISNGTTNETANLTIPLKGPKASGVVHYAGTRNDGKWEVSDFSVIVTGSNKRISLSH
ncbi:MAG TPA: cytochrome c oxidase assembly factor Coa1 family protein [Chthoniobacter sp.]|jgi:hypothetical protein